MSQGANGEEGTLGLTGGEIQSLYELYAPVIHRRALALVRRDADAWVAQLNALEHNLDTGNNLQGALGRLLPRLQRCGRAQRVRAGGDPPTRW